MTPRILTSIAAVGAALVVGVPTAWGAGEPYRDHGDAYYDGATPARSISAR